MGAGIESSSWRHAGGRTDPDLEIGATIAAASAVVAVRGEVDALTAPTLTAVLLALAGEDHIEMTLDLAGCTFMSAAGLRTIDATSTILAASGGTLTVRDASTQILRILHITGVDEVVQLESGLDAALQLSGPPAADAAVPALGAGTDVGADLAHLVAASTAVGGLVEAALGLIVALADATVRGADGASITLQRDGRFTTVASTDETIRRMDDHQYETGEGPCLDAAREGRRFQTDSIDADGRWPLFGPLASEEGIGSVLSTPLPGDSGQRGALNIYARRDAAFGERQRERATLLASQAAQVVEAAAPRAADEHLDHRIARSLEGRQTIAQAQGMIMARRHVPAELAAAMLHRAARSGEVTVLRYAEDMISAMGDAELIG